MATVKTAVSVQKSLFDQVESLAKRLHISRSRLYSLALANYIEHYQNQALLEEINVAYSGEPDSADRDRLTKMRKHHRKIVEGEW
jgi:metal-responsive CopG/Arc/MetJ family transcriptional regulator